MAITCFLQGTTQTVFGPNDSLLAKISSFIHIQSTSTRLLLNELFLMMVCAALSVLFRSIYPAGISGMESHVCIYLAKHLCTVMLHYHFIGWWCLCSSQFAELIYCLFDEIRQRATCTYHHHLIIWAALASSRHISVLQALIIKETVTKVSKKCCSIALKNGQTKEHQ